MSSFLGHAVIGAAIVSGAPCHGRREQIVALAAGTALAVCPDVDYILYWTTGVDLEPRYTHSICVCIVAALIAWGLVAMCMKSLINRRFIVYLFAASLSHLVLDFLVAVHPMPLFWPFSSTPLVMPHGVLPSAGRVNLFNYYLWRNLAIESGILLPAALWISPISRSRISNLPVGYRWLIAALFVGFVAWGFSLHR